MALQIQFRIQKLNRFIVANPAFADNPVGPIKGKPTTPREALAKLQRGEDIPEVIAMLSAAGIDPPEQDWQLVEDYYMRLLRLPGPHPKIYIIGTKMTLEEALLAVRRRDPVGQQLLSSYQGMLREMARRMK